jgi:hypothetical protein
MITCDLRGGLGNQLFQIFTTISYAIENKHPFNFLYSENLGKRNTYWDSFLIALKKFTVLEFPKMHVIQEGDNFHYVELPKQFEEENTQLHGFFQSYKYFESNYNVICNLIRLEKHKTIIKEKFMHNFDNLVSLHFRVGDYKMIQHCHPIMKFSYYKNSIQHIIQKTNNNRLKILYFCEKCDNDYVFNIIETLNNIFPDCKFIKVDQNAQDWEQMLMMSLCQHNVIANSTFSWWGAYFNSHEDKIVCYPDIWFGPTLSYFNVNDLFPNSWTKINA